MNKLKIKVFLLNHKTKIYILLTVIILLIFFNIPINIPTTEDPTIIGVVGTLLGAIVGGIFSLIGSIYVNNKQIKSNSEVKRKNIIYRPLYDELLETRKIIEIENPFSSYVTFKKGYQTMLRHPEITAWDRICSDGRILDTPNILKKQYENYLQSIKQYIDIRNSADDVIQNVVNEVLNKRLNTECTITNLGSCMSSDILKNDRKQNIVKYHCNNFLKEKKDITDAEWNDIEEEVFSICNDKDEIKDIREKYFNWLEVQNETIKLLELLILEINIKYEKQRR